MMESEEREPKAEILEPEIEEGNVEYKLKMNPQDSYRLEQLATQMQWRIEEGDGHAIYRLGVRNNGMKQGIGGKELEKSFDTLRMLCKKVGATMKVLSRTDGKEEGTFVFKIMVKQYKFDYNFI